jgi:hypothetical protein
VDQQNLKLLTQNKLRETIKLLNRMQMHQTISHFCHQESLTDDNLPMVEAVLTLQTILAPFSSKAIRIMQLEVAEFLARSLVLLLAVPLA